MGQLSFAWRAGWATLLIGMLSGTIALPVQAQPNGVIHSQERVDGLYPADLEAFKKLDTNREFLIRQKRLSSSGAKDGTVSEIKIYGSDPLMQETLGKYKGVDAVITWKKYQKKSPHSDPWAKLTPLNSKAQALKRDPKRDRVIKDLVIVQLTKRDPQKNVSANFCKDPQDVNCRNGVAIFGGAVGARILAKPPLCKQMQAAVSEILDFNGGNADLIAPDQLKIVTAYYTACTTPTLPEKMRNVLGIIIDTDANLHEPATGILIGKRRYAAIGMAVQLSATRIYTARHVLYSGEIVGRRRFSEPRTVSKLLYIPLAMPGKTIKLISEVRPPQIEIDNADAPNDQAVLELAEKFVPLGAKWPIVRRMAIMPLGGPTPLYIAGFHPSLARADAAGKPKPELLTLSNWRNYIRRDNNSTCLRVTQNVEGCMLHTCDTVGGLSGAPVFVDPEAGDDGRPVVIGIHRGAAFNLADTVCSAGLPGSGINMATLPNAAFLQK